MSGPGLAAFDLGRLLGPGRRRRSHAAAHRFPGRPRAPAGITEYGGFVIPHYNKRDLVAEAVASVARQAARWRSWSSTTAERTAAPTAWAAYPWCACCANSCVSASHNIRVRAARGRLGRLSRCRRPRRARTSGGAAAAGRAFPEAGMLTSGYCRLSAEGPRPAACCRGCGIGLEAGVMPRPAAAWRASPLGAHWINVARALHRRRVAS
jgi:hypothetical protein